MGPHRNRGENLRLIGTSGESRRRSAAHFAIACAHSGFGLFSGSLADRLCIRFHSGFDNTNGNRTGTGDCRGGVARKSLYSDSRFAETSTDTNAREWRSRGRKKRANAKQSTGWKRNCINGRVSAAEHYCFVHNLTIVCAIRRLLRLPLSPMLGEVLCLRRNDFNVFHSRGGPRSATLSQLTTRARERSAVRRASDNS